MAFLQVGMVSIWAEGRALCHQQREPLVRTAAVCSQGGGTVGLEEVGQKCVSPSAWEEVEGKLIQALKST